MGVPRPAGRSPLARRAAEAEAFGIQDLESEGGGIAEPPRANPRPGRLNAIHERRILSPMSNLIAKIRHWLHLEKKPKT